MMKCTECREQMVEYIEGLLDGTSRDRMDGHLAECAACQTELQEVWQLTMRLARDGLDAPPVSLEAAVMDRIFQEQALLIRRLKMRKRMRIFGMSGAMAAAVAVLFVVGLWLAEPAEAQKAAEVLALGAAAVPQESTVHITAKVRTLPRDNFGSIGADYDLVPVEIWKQFGKKPKWRVEKPGRVVVMDGDSTTALIRPDVVAQIPIAVEDAFGTYWLLALTRVKGMIMHELSVAQAKKWDMTLTHETTGAGEKMIVTVEAKSGLPDDDYLKNKFFEDADIRRVYRFDAKTKRLEGFEAYMHKPDGDVLVLDVEHIEYDKPIDTEVFKLRLPETVHVFQEPERLPDNEKYEKMTPEQAARSFFEACGKKDWDEVRKFLSPCTDRFKEGLGGLELISLGKPFKSKGYGGWFVPYEIKLTNEEEFTVCCENPTKRCIVFGWGAGPSEGMIAKLKSLANDEKYEKMTPKEAVQAMLTAYKEKNAEEVRRLSGGLIPVERTKMLLANVEVLSFSVGEPFESEKAGYWNVPVEIEMITKHNLALRNDNSAKRFVVDGGI